MEKSKVLIPSQSEVLEVLMNDGVVVLPSKLGYGILAISELAVEKFYSIKNRPMDKPSGVLATPEIFAAVTHSEFKNEVGKFHLPVGLIENPNRNHPAIQQLPSVTTLKKSIAFFFNLDPFMTAVAKLAWKHQLLITLSSANKAGTGNSLEYAHLHVDFKTQVELSIEGDQLAWQKERGKFDLITSTIIDLPNRRHVRDGIFADRVKALALELQMITTHLEKLPLRNLQQPKFTSCLYLLSYKESTYRKIPNIRNIDWLILDLEDGCPPDNKADARKLIEFHAHQDTFDHHFVGVRLNELQMEDELEKDLQINFTNKIYGFALPMLRAKEDVQRYDRKISEMEHRLQIKEGTFKFFPIIETVEGLHQAVPIAMASPRNIGLFLGHADLLAEMDGSRTQENLHHIRMLYLNAARVAGIPAFDTPFENVYDFEGLKKDALQGQQIGLDGKVVLNFDQKELVNKTFGISASQQAKSRLLLEQYQGGCHIIDGVFLAPPIVKKLENDLKKKVYKSTLFPVKSSIGKTLEYGLDFKKAFPGQIILSPYETTIDESWITSWQGMVQTGNPLETSIDFCQKIGLQGRLVPFQLLVNLGLCLVVESFSESSLFHLGISKVVYERPVFVGDTIRSLMIIDKIVPASNKKYTIFKTRMILVNQNQERVVSMNRNSLFPFIDADQILKKPVHIYHSDFHFFLEDINLDFRSNLLKQIDSLESATYSDQIKFEKGELILHSLVRPMGLSNSLTFSTLYKNTHPLHINNARYGMEGLVVCGGFIIPIIHGAASRDIRFAIDHEIVDTMHINSIHHDDSIGAMTFIVDVEKVDQNIECLTLRTFGLKNIDAERDLRDVQIPNEILQSPKIKPREIELLCKTYCPDLHRSICARMTWRMWRKVS